MGVATDPSEHVILRTPGQFCAELVQRNALLAYGSVGVLALCLVLLGLWVQDAAPPVLGLNRWVKPFKFAVSISIFLATTAWLLGDIQSSRMAQLIAWTIMMTMVLEMVWLVVQAAQGRASHFNIQTPRDGLLFGLAGVFISINTVAMGVLLGLLYLQPRPELPPGWLAAVRLGLWLFLIGSLVGGMMVSRLSHSIGGLDGGAGLPLLNWSRTHGDLRVAHFVGLHALQLVPLAAAVAWQFGGNALLWGRIATGVVTGCLLVVWTQALQGLPVWR